MTPTIHTPSQIGPHRLKNRLVALPVFTGYAYPDGSVSPPLLKHYADLAASGVSMVVVANVAVSPKGVTSRYNLRVDDDKFIPGLRDLVSAIKRQGALACIQLNHAGRFAKTDQPLLASPVEAANITYHVASLKGFMHAFPFEKRFGLTRFFLKQISRWRRAMTEEDMNTVVVQFYQAAKRACLAGFDFIELHGANGYLLCEFLSPATNKRSDAFGGPLKNRSAFPLAIVHEIRQRLPDRVPLGFRLLLHEWTPDSIQLEDAITFAILLEQAGVSYVSAAAANFNSIFSASAMRKMGQLAYLREDMVRLTSHVTIPTIISGRITTPTLAEELLKQGAGTLVGLGRSLRVDTDWVNKTIEPTSSIKLCLNCNWCLKSVILEQGFVCQQWPKTRQLKTQLDRMLLTRNCNGLWVISDQEDLVLFKETVLGLLPVNQGGKWDHPITIIFLESFPNVDSSTRARADFIAWIRRRFNHVECYTRLQSSAGKRVHNSWDKDICEEINRRGQSLVFLGRNRNQPWRERLLYTLRNKVVGLISPNKRLKNVAVFLDFSDASLLVLAFVQQVFINRPGVRLRFVHAFDGSKTRADRHWSRLKEVVGLNKAEQLDCIPSGDNPATAIIEDIARGRFGTIIMGKRGLTGIKRLLLGSVSRAVLRKINDQTLLLVD